MTGYIRLIGVLVVLAVMLAMTTGAQAKSGPVTVFTPQSGGTYDYGIVDAGNHADQAFTLTNSGGTATAALKISLTGSSAFSKIADTCSASSLGPGKKCAVTVRYAPTGSGGDTATLTATSTKPAATASVTLKGTGGVANVQISPASKDFGSTSGSQTFTATNNGNISTGTYAFSGPSDSHFGLTGTNTCNGTALAPSGSCSFTIAFTALAGCGAEPTLYQDSASLGSYASATVKGEQEQCLPALAWSPCSPSIPGCWFFINSIDSTPYTLTLTNNGQAATGDLTFSLIDEANFGLFELAPASGPGDCQNVSTLSVGSSCTVSITLTDPSQLGCTAPYDQPVVELRVTDATYNTDAASIFVQEIC